MRNVNITAAVVRFAVDRTDRVITAAVVIAHAFHLGLRMCLAMPLSGSKRGTLSRYECRQWQRPFHQRRGSLATVAA